MSREVWDADGRMTVEWMTLGRAGLLLAMLTGKSRGYSKQQVAKLFREYELTVYDTPLGRLVHEEDVQECARRIGWWRKEPVQGYLGGSPYCSHSGTTVSFEGDPPKKKRCPCGFEFTVVPVELSRGLVYGGLLGSYKVPTHKSRRAKPPTPSALGQRGEETSLSTTR